MTSSSFSGHLTKIHVLHASLAQLLENKTFIKMETCDSPPVHVGENASEELLKVTGLFLIRRLNTGCTV